MSSVAFRFLYKSELEYAQNKIDDRFADILAKQEALQVLDADFMIAKKELSKAARNTRTAVAYDDYGRKDPYDPGYVEATEQESSWREYVRELKHRIANEEESPPGLCFCLPRTKERAVQWLFFLYMPDDFRDLSALAHSGQSKLWKDEVPCPGMGCEDLRSWFVSHKSTAPPLEPEDTIGLRSSNRRLFKPYTPCIRQYTKETDVFFPDDLSPEPLWKLTDPFSEGRKEDETVKLFTEMLPKAHRSEYMQQFMPILPSNTRGNIGIAQRGKKPDWLSSESFCKFSTMRAYPNMQIRELVTALVEDTLPFEHECVHVLVKQVLFHIGEDDWKVELREGWAGLERLAELMNRQADILAKSPKDSGKVLLFGVISSFLGQYDQAHLDCARRFTKIARQWADDMERNIDSNTPPEVYWTQAKFYASALLCHSTGGYEVKDYLEMAELIVLFRHKTLFAAESFETEPLDLLVSSVMASRIEGINKAIQSDPGHLTSCIGLAVDVPRNLNWEAVLDASSCFDATSVSSSQLYSVNLLNGVLLINGVPPGFLPLSITQDPLYLRTFGSQNFEIVVLGSQHYATARSVKGGRFYEFLCDSSLQLHIIECSSRPDLSQENQFRLLLLRKDLISLPILLQEEHSHWFSMRHDFAVVRGPSYKSRKVQYVVNFENTYIIPLNLQNSSLDHIDERLFECDRLFLGKTAVTDVLNEFECIDFIHMSVNPNETALRYTLPRLKLTFDQTDQAVTSNEFAGFDMRKCQTLEGTLYGVNSYLVLERHDGQQKVLARSGKISRGGKTEISNHWQAHCGYHTYDIHRRFGNLIATNREGRLHLAGLYVSSSSYFAERRLSKPGTVVATELVRQCWINEPLSAREQMQLIEVSKLSYLSCTLRLMCSWIWQSSNSVRFLHTEEPQPSIESLDLDFLAVDEYFQNRYTPRLLPYEELLLLGTVQPCTPTVPLEGYKHKPMAYYSYVVDIEQELCKLPIETKANNKTMPFPLKKMDATQGLEAKVYDDLIKSWEDYCRLPEKRCLFCFGGKHINGILQTVRVFLQQSETELFNILCHGNESIGYRLSQISGRRAIATQLDFLSIVWDDHRIMIFNPFLDTKARMETRLKIVEWMMLCVLEDKLIRILNIHAHALLGEMECVREWNPFEHPKWLAFEAEQQIQIRPYQYSIVKQLLENPGSCTQLNMGLGKTRVMLPMLVLELSQTTDSTVRVTALSAIVHEAMEHMRSVLVASVQNVRVFSMPFNRDNSLDKQHAAVLTEELARCRDHLGCLIVTPQHRNSLLLKQYDSGVFVNGLTCRFSDVVDETDAILDHDFQLAYAIGRQAPLPEGPCRWGMVEAFLQIMARGVGEDGIDNILNDPRLVHKESTRFGAFPKLRLLAPFKSFEVVVGPALCRRLIANPPHEFRWMKGIPQDDRDRLVSMISCRRFRDVISIIQSDSLLGEFESDIIAARGCIAHGILFHSLYARYRVNFGLDKTRGRKMAVPYAASDTPKARAEYSHPDMAIIYTCLSYYQEGLVLTQFKSALVCLQSLGRMAQGVLFRDWVSSVRQDVDPEELLTFDDILKVDVDNSVQLSLIHRHLFRSMEVISFWMNNFVFPDSTYQFPSRRVTSAWNLVDSGQAIGFSGTDVTRFLLPLDIKQVLPSDPKLRSANGEMIDRVIQCNNRIILLDDSGGDSRCPLWKGIVDQCISLKLSALIDVAGLMAGSANEEVAQFMAGELSDTSRRGVVYFNVRVHSWFVYELENVRHFSLKDSSLTEAECFVYFDQSRCRGADLKLHVNACALVTLEPKLRKDRFLQGCMRMRNLRQGGQSLILAGTSESVSSEMMITQVLEKMLQNSVNMVKEGVVAFLERGMNFYSFPKETKEDITLGYMYGSNMIDHKDLKAYLDSSHEVESLSSAANDLVSYCKEIGQGVQNQTSRLAEECEQEMEREVENEEEEEVQLRVEKPYAEFDWDYEKAFSDPESLIDKNFFTLKRCAFSFAKDIPNIQWSPMVLCTKNFWQSIRPSPSRPYDLMNYLRPVNSVLCLPLGRIILVSEYEAHKLLPYWISAKSPKATFHHLCMIDSGKGFGKERVVGSQKALTSVKLFRGCVQYSELQRDMLSGMFPEVHVRTAVQYLLAMRDRTRYFDRSDLDEFSSKLLQP
jgi:hypothetical protein